MAGYTYNSEMQQIPIPDAAGATDSEERPNLDMGIAPPPNSPLQDAATGDPVVPGGRAFTRVVSGSGDQTDAVDPGA